MIRAALSRGLRNIGADCGKSGLLVIDEDRPGAFAEYAASIREVIPATFTVVTSKGRHLYFRQPAGGTLGNGTGALSGRGIDIRGRGGFVVAPGSVHQTGTLYAPADPATAVAPAPGWLVSALRSAPPGAVVSPGPTAHEGSVHGRLRGAVAIVLDAKPGERNKCLHWAACRAAEMVAAGQLGQATAVDVLMRAGKTVGLGHGEAQATIGSAMKGVSA